MNIADILKKQIPENDFLLLQEIGTAAADAGMRAFIVGGVVRDIITACGGSLDLDVVVEGNAIELARIIAAQKNAEIVTHNEFRTATVYFSSGQNVDFATARSETYASPGALPDVQPAAIEQDLKRRDFSINAMAASITPDNFGELHDPFNGADDIEKKMLRVLHEKSFEDDPTRILRGIRFSARFGFKFDEKTIELIENAVKGGFLANVSAARIEKELIYLSEEPNRGIAVKLGNEHGIDGALIEGLSFNPNLLFPEDMVLDSFKTIEQANGKPGAFADNALCGITAMLAGVPENAAEAFAERIEAGGTLLESIRQISGSAIKDLLVELGTAGIRNSQAVRVLEGLTDECLVILHAAGNEQMKSLVKNFVVDWRKIKLEISGDDLKDAGHEPSAEFGRVLREVQEAKINGDVVNRSQELELALKLIKDM